MFYLKAMSTRLRLTLRVCTDQRLFFWDIAERVLWRYFSTWHIPLYLAVFFCRFLPFIIYPEENLYSRYTYSVTMSILCSWSFFCWYLFSLQQFLLLYIIRAPLFRTLSCSTKYDNVISERKIPELLIVYFYTSFVLLQCCKDINSWKVCEKVDNFVSYYVRWKFLRRSQTTWL